MKQLLSMSSFEWVDQHHFAQLSGDRNPLHLDPVAARRALFGRPVVHGIHVLLRALDQWIAQRPPATGGRVLLRRLRCRFPNPTFLETPVEFWLDSEAAGHVKLRALCEGATVLYVDLQWAHDERRGGERPLPLPGPEESARPCRPRTLAELEGSVGTLPLWGDLDAIATDLPDLARRVSPRQIAELLACTRLVGMECPGLYSIFSSLDLERGEPELAHDLFDYAVARVVPRASLVQIDVASSGFTGRIDAFRRPEASRTPHYDVVAQRVQPGAFADQTALVVGGSRGIGAVTAKLLAAGGAHVIATYHRGEDDALALAREIRASGGRCDIVHCDVASPGKALNWLDAQGIVTSHLYYFASPPIFVKRPGTGYSQDLYQRFAAAYVDGFAALLLACLHRRRRGITAFYPSSVAVEKPVASLEEYSDAKRAGERLCREFDETPIPIRIRIARLPRIDTDQTASLIRVPAASALDVMCEELKLLKEQMNG